MKVHGTRLLWIVGVVLVGFAAQNAWAEREVYRCVYPDGRIEFRGMPVLEAVCARVSYGQVDSDPSMAAPATPTEGWEADVKETAEPVDPSVEPVDPRVRNCEIARENLEMLESGSQVVVTGPDGNPALLSEGDRAERLAQTRRDVDYWCGESTGER